MKMILRLTALALMAAMPGAAGTFSSPSSLSSSASLFEKSFHRLVPTFWCGSGNSAPNPDLLSEAYPHIDSCCRDHDYCPDIIERNRCNRGICNESPLLPILSCECELELQRCLGSLPTTGLLGQLPISHRERHFARLAWRIYFQILPKLVPRKCIQKRPQLSYSSYKYLCEGDATFNSQSSPKGNSKTQKWTNCRKVPLTQDDTWELVDLVDAVEGNLNPRPYPQGGITRQILPITYSSTGFTQSFNK